MIGLIYVVFLGLYLWLSVTIVRGAARSARRHDRNARRWAWTAGVVMYLVLFWDLIPTHVLHRYYCATQGGFTVYEALAQWEQENPGVVETLEPIRNPPWVHEGETIHIPLNQRFAWEITTRHHPLHIRERGNRIVDMETGKVLVRYVDFDTDVLGVERGTAARGIRDYKFWLAATSCEGTRKRERVKFNGIIGTIENMGTRYGHQ